MTVIDPESALELGDEPSESLDGQLRPQPVERHLVPHPVHRAEFVDYVPEVGLLFLDGGYFCWEGAWREISCFKTAAPEPAFSAFGTNPHKGDPVTL